jgi:hypothetical protein
LNNIQDENEMPTQAVLLGNLDKDIVQLKFVGGEGIRKPRSHSKVMVRKWAALWSAIPGNNQDTKPA